MNSKKRSVLLISGALLLTSCASSISNNTNAKSNRDKLQAEVMKLIGVYESALGASNNPRLLSIDHIRNIEEMNSGVETEERWIVENDNQKVSYLVTLLPTWKRETQFMLSREISEGLSSATSLDTLEGSNSFTDSFQKNLPFKLGSDYKIFTQSVNNGELYYLRCNNNSLQCRYIWKDLCNKGTTVSATPDGTPRPDQGMAPAWINHPKFGTLRMFMCTE